MKAFFRVDASPRIGSGHLSRCLTLARALAVRGVAVTFGTHAPTEHTLSWIAASGAQAVALERPLDAAEAVVRTGDAELVLVDGYEFDANYQARLRKAGRVVCVFDDLGEAPVGGDVVLNGNLYAGGLRYEVREQLLGPAFALVRDEFVAARAERERRALDAAEHVPPRLLVTMGGADPTHETDKALSALAFVAHPLSVRVIVGGANPRTADIRALAKQVAKHDVEVHVDVRHMGEMMAWADVCLTASGSTCLELTCVGVASVAVQVVENQRLIARELASRGLMTVTGTSSETTTRALADAVEDLLASRARRLVLEAAQRTLVDGLGPARVAARLIELAARG